MYLTTSDMEQELDLQYHVHAALDVVEEKCLIENHKMYAQRGAKANRCFLSAFSYGFVTNSRVKFIVVIDSENEVRATFRNLHILYTDAVCNPFYIPGESLTFKKFDRAVQKLMSGNA
ncbi:trafficking protein particle complex subunit 2-like protein [Drosophila miranda]|uniref:trafficking protein particle complex subunit 2-like protein n=1 Tax=Drosophila miranda TaxID=7229 RepID=UPI00143F7E34|nr:trafficking protein particle complex subunit 2-like protein [Drosophila miranda]